MTSSPNPRVVSTALTASPLLALVGVVCVLVLPGRSIPAPAAPEA